MADVGQAGGTPLSASFVVSFALIPVARVAEQALMVANLAQIAVWGCLFVWLGRFEGLYPAIYDRR